MNKNYIQRELSWNDFNARVLELATNKESGLLDRLKFISIVSSNYDEFFMVRVAGLMNNVSNGNASLPPTNQRPSEILQELLSEVRKIILLQDSVLTREILPGLAIEGLTIKSPEQWEEEERNLAENIFWKELSPIVTPLGLDNKNSLIDQLLHNQIHAAFSLDNGKLGVVGLPANLSRFCNVSVHKTGRCIILLDDILLNFGGELFPGNKIVSRCLFRVTRSADMAVNEERDEDFMEAMEEVLLHRKQSSPVRLETHGNRDLSGKICTMLDLSEMNHFHSEGYLKLKDFIQLTAVTGFDYLQLTPPSPQTASDLSDTGDIWEVLKDRDVLLHHPYEHYTPVIRMVEESVEAPETLAIKMTLYRTSGTSSIVKALLRAAKKGIQVTVLVEIKARFDEGANIAWAQQLRNAGAIVVYGLAMLKVHAKMLMVVRREDEGVIRYLHLGTGNYNESTARMYTDMGLMTSREDITRDAAFIFNAITGYSSEPRLSTVFMAPFGLRRKTLQLIGRETKRAKDGEDARIMAKLNSLVDVEIIDALYEASSAGVRIDLNIRGICCLKPGIKGLSENIRVVSIIDTFLEHTRAFAYFNGGTQDVYLSSADWMTRNLDRRVEILFPVISDIHKQRILSMLMMCFKDNCQSWQLCSEGNWERRVPGDGEEPFRVQSSFALQAASLATERKKQERQALRVRRESEA